MKYYSAITKLLARMKDQVGFTMIELLIVISILGILAVAVLSAINPIEQINRGRDTGSQSDAEQMISAIDRYYAYNGTYPWQGTASGASGIDPAIGWAVLDDELAGANGDLVFAELLAKDELKTTFLDRIDSATNPLSIYNGGVSGNATYVCFNPQSKAFQEQATARCADLPDDLDAAAGDICPPAGEALYCLP